MRLALFRLLFPREAVRLQNLAGWGRVLILSVEDKDAALNAAADVPTGDDYNEVVDLVRAFARRVEA